MTKALLVALVKGYRLLLSPWIGASCRFEPTCSVYALQALEQHGAAAGSYLAVARIARCGPWCEGGCDPVPAQPPRFFSRLREMPGSARISSSLRPAEGLPPSDRSEASL